jgi:hypothetical protein
VFHNLFTKRKRVLAGAPPIRRMKTYSAASGYVYQYFYEGHRVYDAFGEHGTEYVFSISPDRKSWHDIGVLVADDAVNGWEAAHQRTLSSTERYAIAKLALFQAFDDRTTPAQLKDPVRVRLADVDGIVETLGL